MRHLIVVFVFFLIMTGVFYIFYKVMPPQSLKPKTPKVDRCDSLESDLFVTKIDLNRYEIALEILKTEDSVAAQKFMEIYSSQTE